MASERSEKGMEDIMNILIEELKKLPKFCDYIDNIEKQTSPIALSGLSSVGKVQLIEATKEFAGKNILLITYNDIQAKRIVEDLKYFSQNVLYFPKRDIAAYDYDASNKDLPYERIETIKIQQMGKNYFGGNFIVVTTIEALMQKMIAKEDLVSKVINFRVGESHDLEELKEKLVNLGYERADIVDGKGQFSIRGGIVDIGTDNSKGIRIEFWGDEVDSIRTFSIATQRSNNMLEEASVYPASEFVLVKSLDEICKSIVEKNSAYEEEDIELIKNGEYFSKIDKYFNSFHTKQSTFLDYITDDFLICVDDLSKINARQANIINDNNELIKSLIEKERFVPDSIKNVSKVNIENIDNNQIIYLEENDVLNENNNLEFSRNVYNFKYRDVHFYKSEINLLIEQIKANIDNKVKFVVLAGNEAGANKIGKLLQQEDINYKYIENLNENNNEKIYKKSARENYEKNQVIISIGVLSSGFRNYDLNLVVITGEEFLVVNKKRKKRSDAFSQGEKVVFADLASRRLCCT